MKNNQNIMLAMLLSTSFFACGQLKRELGNLNKALNNLEIALSGKTEEKHSDYLVDLYLEGTQNGTSFSLLINKPLPYNQASNESQAREEFKKIIDKVNLPKGEKLPAAIQGKKIQLPKGNGYDVFEYTSTKPLKNGPAFITRMSLGLSYGPVGKKPKVLIESTKIWPAPSEGTSTTGGKTTAVETKEEAGKPGELQNGDLIFQVTIDRKEDLETRLKKIIPQITVVSDRIDIGKMTGQTMQQMDDLNNKLSQKLQSKTKLILQLDDLQSVKSNGKIEITARPTIFADQTEESLGTPIRATIAEIDVDEAPADIKQTLNKIIIKLPITQITMRGYDGGLFIRFPWPPESKELIF